MEQKRFRDHPEELFGAGPDFSIEPAAAKFKKGHGQAGSRPEAGISNDVLGRLDEPDGYCGR